MTLDISGISDAGCVALSGLRCPSGQLSGALRLPAEAVRTLRAQDPVSGALRLAAEAVRTLRAQEEMRVSNRELIGHVPSFNRNT